MQSIAQGRLQDDIRDGASAAAGWMRQLISALTSDDDWHTSSATPALDSRSDAVPWAPRFRDEAPHARLLEQSIKRIHQDPSSFVKAARAIHPSAASFMPAHRGDHRPWSPSDAPHEDLSPEQACAAGAALSCDRQLRALRFQLVPRAMSEGTFWRTYFALVDDARNRVLSNAQDQDWVFCTGAADNDARSTPSTLSPPQPPPRAAEGLRAAAADAPSAHGGLAGTAADNRSHTSTTFGPTAGCQTPQPARQLHTPATPAPSTASQCALGSVSSSCSSSTSSNTRPSRSPLADHQQVDVLHELLLSPLRDLVELVAAPSCVVQGLQSLLPTTWASPADSSSQAGTSTWTTPEGSNCDRDGPATVGASTPAGAPSASVNPREVAPALVLDNCCSTAVGASDVVAATSASTTHQHPHYQPSHQAAAADDPGLLLHYTRQQSAAEQQQQYQQLHLHQALAAARRLQLHHMPELLAWPLSPATALIAAAAAAAGPGSPRVVSQQTHISTCNWAAAAASSMPSSSGTVQPVLGAISCRGQAKSRRLWSGARGGSCQGRQQQAAEAGDLLQQVQDILQLSGPSPLTSHHLSSSSSSSGSAPATDDAAASPGATALLRRLAPALAAAGTLEQMGLLWDELLQELRLRWAQAQPLYGYHPAAKQVDHHQQPPGDCCPAPSPHKAASTTTTMLHLLYLCGQERCRQLQGHNHQQQQQQQRGRHCTFPAGSPPDQHHHWQSQQHNTPRASAMQQQDQQQQQLVADASGWMLPRRGAAAPVEGYQLHVTGEELWAPHRQVFSEGILELVEQYLLLLLPLLLQQATEQQPYNQQQQQQQQLTTSGPCVGAADTAHAAGSWNILHTAFGGTVSLNAPCSQQVQQGGDQWREQQQQQVVQLLKQPAVQQLQVARLKSWVSAFKAANPGCCFLDFMVWLQATLPPADTSCSSSSSSGGAGNPAPRTTANISSSSNSSPGQEAALPLSGSGTLCDLGAGGSETQGDSWAVVDSRLELVGQPAGGSSTTHQVEVLQPALLHKAATAAHLQLPWTAGCLLLPPYDATLWRQLFAESAPVEAAWQLPVLQVDQVGEAVLEQLAGWDPAVLLQDTLSAVTATSGTRQVTPAAGCGCHSGSKGQLASAAPSRADKGLQHEGGGPVQQQQVMSELREGIGIRLSGSSYSSHEELAHAAGHSSSSVDAQQAWVLL